MTDYFELGRIVKPQGIRGEVKAEVYTDDPDRFYDLDFVLFREDGRYVKRGLEAVRVTGGFAYLKFQGADDRNTAETLRGQYLYIDRARAARLPEGRYYIQDLLGMEVLDDAGKRLGVLENILQPGGRDVYVVRLAEGGTLLFPVLDDVFRKKDVEGGVMVVCRERLAEVAVYDI